MAVHDMLMAAGGVSTGPVNYIDDVFSTYLYTGNSSTQTINNGIDLATEGGMVWLKSRSNAHNAHIYDTERGTTTAIYPAATNGNTTESQGLQSFSTTGFSLGAATDINSDPESLVSWTFRKKAKFFDIVTYSGTGSARTIAHNLGSKPGFIIIKKTSSSDAWVMWHRGLTSADYYLRFNTFAETLLTTMWNSTEPTSSVFSVGTRSEVNASGSNYIAYIFAHDAGGFGAAGTDNVISCGTISGASTIDLGYEPQFIMVKRIDASGDYWYMNDNMRGLPASFSNKYLIPSSTAAEATGSSISLTSTGFTWASSGTYVYIAIRRPMKPPTTGTSVFKPFSSGASVTNGIPFVGTFPPDLHIEGERSASSGKHYWSQRITGINTLNSTTTSAQSTDSIYWDNMVGQRYGDTYNFSGRYAYDFKRAPGFFDVVCYTGDGTNRTIAHNLGVAPELIIVKKRSASGAWNCYHTTLGNTNYVRLNETSASASDGGVYWNSTTPTSSVFSLGTGLAVNESGSTLVAYLFATLAGVSKVGTVNIPNDTNNINVNCGFSTGARFVLMKRYNTTGAWYVFDTSRGITSGNDPYVQFNVTDAEVTNEDRIAPYASGFTINNGGNGQPWGSGDYIYLAIA